jgi:hypothetical protein
MVSSENYGHYTEVTPQWKSNPFTQTDKDIK